jgi:hypothetical protein
MQPSFAIRSLRAEGHADSQLPHPFADRVCGHPEDTRDREHRAHESEHTQRDRCDSGRTICRIR